MRLLILRFRRGSTYIATLLCALLLCACGGNGDQPTRTPVPTWTPTVGAPDAAAAAQQPAAEEPVVAPIVPADTPVPQEPVVIEQPVQEQAPVEVPTDTPVPPTNTPEPPTSTPEPTPLPTETPTPAPTATPNYAFALETAEKLPTESLAANVVRIWLYVYSPSNFGLPGYRVRVSHNGSALTVEEESAGGIPQTTRPTDGPWTRFTNLNVILVESQEGVWEVQLLDAEGIPAGPPASFTLSADEVTRELYVRYIER